MGTTSCKFKDINSFPDEQDANFFHTVGRLVGQVSNQSIDGPDNPKRQKV